MKGFMIAAGLLASSVSGHMQMSKPYPLRSPLNKDLKGPKDYSYTNPLSPSGSDYPCKGYADDDFQSQADYTPGSEYEMELSGSATHEGGSCQIGLSYDKGETIRVIHSILGGCPIDKKYKFTVPSDAPSGEALLAWTWFNKVGNREMYMNCAQVTIKGGSNREANREMTTPVTRRDSFDSLPEIFQANIQGEGDCTTTEGKEVNFPKPGPSVEGSLSGKGYECKGSAPFLGSSKAPESGVSHASSPAKPSSTMSSMASMARPSSSSVHGRPSSMATPSSMGAMAHASNMVASPFGDAYMALAKPTGAESGREIDHPWGPPHGDHPWGPPHHPHWGCRDGTIICAPNGLHWAMCDHGHPVPMGPVAAGMICKHGEMVRAW